MNTSNEPTGLPEIAPPVGLEVAAFESWARRLFKGAEVFDRISGRPGGWEYNGDRVQAAWAAWQQRAAQQPAPPSATGGVPADILRIVDTAIDVCNDRDRPAMAEDLEAVRLYVEQAASALAQQPAAPGIGLQWLVDGLDEIGSECRNLRQGGCDVGDLAGLEAGLSTAVDTAHELRDRLLALIDASPKGGSDAPEKLSAFLRWCADELVKRDSRAGSFASGVADSLRGRASTLDEVDRRQATSAEVKP